MADRNSSESRLPVRLKMRLQAVLLCGILGLPSIIVTITLFIITQVSAVTRVTMIHQSYMVFHDSWIDWQYNNFTNIFRQTHHQIILSRQRYRKPTQFLIPATVRTILSCHVSLYINFIYPHNWLYRYSVIILIIKKIGMYLFI